LKEVIDGLIEVKSSGMKTKIVNTVLTIIEDEEYQNVEDFEWLLLKLKQLIPICPSLCEQRLSNTLKVINSDNYRMLC
jgi:hypothetical protein